MTGQITLNTGGGLVVGNSNALGSGGIVLTAAASLFGATYGTGVSTPILMPNPLVLDNFDLTIRGDRTLSFGGVVNNVGPGGTRIMNVTMNAGVTMVGTTTFGGVPITGLVSTANLAVGWVVSGPGIFPGTRITAINSASSITISNIASFTYTELKFSPVVDFAGGITLATLIGTETLNINVNVFNSIARVSGIVTDNYATAPSAT